MNAAKFNVENMPVISHKNFNLTNYMCLLHCIARVFLDSSFDFMEYNVFKAQFTGTCSLIVFCCYNFPNLQCGKFLKCELLVFQVHEAGKQGVEKPESLEAKPRGLSGFETPCFPAK